MTDMSLAEELLLVALDDEKGADTANWGGGVEAGLAGALLLELAAAGCLKDEDDKLVATDCDPPTEPLAAAALDAIRHDGKRRDARAWVGRLPKELKPLRRQVAAGLVRHGVLEEERRRRLGLFETTRYPEPERRLRAGLTEVLVAGRKPTPREAMLISLLHAYDLVKRVVPREDRRAARKRAKAIAEGDAIGAAVGTAVSEVQAATMAAVVAATAATTASAGGDSGAS
jgi:hypothetical protein